MGKTRRQRSSNVRLTTRSSELDEAANTLQTDELSN